MSFSRFTSSCISRAAVFILAGVVVGFAQQPEDFWAAPTVLVQGECYDVWVTPLSPGMSLDIQYTLNDGPVQTVYGWPSMDETGFARNICTNFSTVPGNYVFVSVKNSQETNWLYVGKTVTVLPQPVALSFDKPYGYAGVDSFVATVTGGESMDVRVRYTWNGYPDLIGVISTDANGQYFSGVIDHYIYGGSFLFTGIQNAAAQSPNWVNINTLYWILPPQPALFYLDKSVILDGATNGDETYHMYAVNGAGILLDFQYSIDNGPIQEVDGWPWLYSYSPGSWTGRSGDISASTCTGPGLYRFWAVRNNNNVAWVPLSPPVEITVVGPGAPEISLISPANATVGQNFTVTVTGQKFCGATLSTTYPGLSVSTTTSTENQVTGVFNIASTAPDGNAVVTLQSYGGTTTFNFGISRIVTPAAPPLRREYIYLGDRVIAVESP